MGAILIKADSESNKILSELAKKLGANVMDLDDEQFEDFALGMLMDDVKTSKTVSKRVIFKRLSAQ